LKDDTRSDVSLPANSEAPNKFPIVNNFDTMALIYFSGVEVGVLGARGKSEGLPPHNLVA
jgi:hypothetical protein